MTSLNDVTPEEWDRVTRSKARDEMIKATLKHKHISNLEEKSDSVNSPKHYNMGGVECIEAIKASMTTLEFQGYCKGNLMKYVWRYNYKMKPLEDLQKASVYLNKLIEEVQ